MKNNKNKKSENLADILIEELKTPIIKLNNMQLEKLKFIKSEVSFIIKNDVKDKKRIEKTFDMFLDLAYWFGDQIEKELAPGEILKVDTGNVVAFEPSVSYEVETVKGLGNIFLGGEGLFLTRLVGPGKVIMQSQNFGDFVGKIIPFLPSRS